MTKRVWDLRGMNLDKIMATSASALDERFEDLVDDAGNMVRDHGGTEEEIETVRELQRQFLEEDRDVYLAKLRAWLERGCETLQ